MARAWPGPGILPPPQKSLDLPKLQLQQQLQQLWHTLSLAEEPGSVQTATATATTTTIPEPPISAKTNWACWNCTRVTCQSRFSSQTLSMLHGPVLGWPWNSPSSQSSLDPPKLQLQQQPPWYTLSLPKLTGPAGTALEGPANPAFHTRNS